MAERALSRYGAQAAASGNLVQRTLNMASSAATGTTIALVAAGAAVSGLAIESLKASAKMETLEVSFRALIGTAEEANTLLKDLTQFALETPFITPQLMEASIELAAFGRQAEEILPDLRMIGDIARGNSKRFQEMVYIYGKIIESGRLYQRDINQLAIRGVPVYIELAKMLGLVDENAKKIPMATYTQIRQLIQAGKINSEMVQEIFKKITAPGGLFHGQLEEGMKTLTGLFSNVEEQVFITFRNIGDLISKSLDLKTINLEIAKLGQEFNNFLKNMTPQTREAIKTVLLLTTAVIGLAAAGYLASVAFTFLTGPIGVVVMIVGGLIALMTKWVLAVGGLSEAWRIVKRAAFDFWDFVKPILPAIGVLFGAMTGPLAPVLLAIALLITYWSDVKEAVLDFYRFAQPTLRALWDLIKFIGFALRAGIVDVIKIVSRELRELGASIDVVWHGLMGRDFSGLKTDLRDFVFFVEYSFRNLSLVGQVAFWEIVSLLIHLVESTKFGFSSVLPAVLASFFDYMKQAWFSMLDVVKHVMAGIIRLVSDGVAKLPNIIAGKLDFKDVVADAYKKAVDDIKTVKVPEFKAPKFEDRPTTEVERNVQKLIKMYRDMLVKGFQAFRADKLLMWQVEDAVDLTAEVFRKIIFPVMFPSEPARAAGQAAGYAYSQAFGNEVKTIDATLFNSAEAISRINEYKAKLRDSQMIERTRIPQIEVAPMPHEPGQQKIIDVLERIDIHIVEQNTKMASNQPLIPAGLF